MSNGKHLKLRIPSKSNVGRQRFQTSDGKIIQLSSFEKHKFMVNKEKSSILAILAIVLDSLKLTLPDLLPGLNPEGPMNASAPCAVGRDQVLLQESADSVQVPMLQCVSPHHTNLFLTPVWCLTILTLCPQRKLQIPQVQGSVL